MNQQLIEPDHQQKWEKSQERIKILDRLIKYLHYNLNHEPEVLDYLRNKRKFANKTIAQFRLGAFPANLDKVLREFSEFELMLAGVAWRSDDGILSSKFCINRLIIPIYDVYGRAVAIIGRVICSEEERVALGVAKYDNTVFSKSRCLFGLHLAKDAIREKGAVLVVEGNFDVISAMQAGTLNVVGSSGAFLHHNQIALLSRFAERIYLGLDADEAGEKATKKILSRPPPEGVILKVQPVPKGFKDWDEYFVSKISA